MKKDKIKNKFFKSIIKIAGNKGLGKNFLGKSVKKYLIENSKTNEIIVNGCKMQFSLMKKIMRKNYLNLFLIRRIQNGLRLQKTDVNIR